ncbi:hypothetical protein ACFYT4_33790 [Streptomyces sp. NPDC004609]|uniref:hypothetical protein n=1 Tax=Streptomyces sp. NPDC004609 TaxID=3364704 RepID=UPI0036749151
MNETAAKWKPTEHGANIGRTSAWMAHRKVALDVHRILSEDDADHAVIYRSRGWVVRRALDQQQ